ncbi:MAG TPA: protein kinase [Bryobacteraceae bacterium]|nr:protein kinase [Bryobacteraceae bacterium]
MIGQTLGHYRIESKLGEGGMGMVYRAFDTHLDRQVAIKLLRPEATVSLERKLRFVQEAKAASALNHPNIIHVYDIDNKDGTDFIAMEFVPGRTLDQCIGRTGLTLRDTLKYGIQIADGLARAHAAGIVHRDLKPANIIVGDDGRVKLLDFGLAKLTETIADDPDRATATMTAALKEDNSPRTEEGSIVGTLAYMSPEQAEGKKVDARSDIFSFGSVLYEMVTGRRAFQGATKISTLSAILREEPRPLGEIAPNVPAELEKIISRCLRKDPDRRTRHMDDVKLAMEDLKEESESGKLSSSSRPLAPSSSRRTLRFAAIAAVAAVALIAAGLALEHWRKPSAPARSEWVQITNLPDSVSQPALSADGHMVTFIRGPRTFYGPGQVYVKILPGGDPVQLTHDDAQKMSPAFSPDGSRIAYTTFALGGMAWDTWEVPVLGGEPRVWLPNASGLVWIDRSKLLFSEVKKGIHMAIVTAEESRAGSRDLYVPPHERGMAHRSYPSPDRKWMLVVEMDERGAFVPCRLVPMDGGSPDRQVGPPGGACTFAAWSPDGQWVYLSSNAGGAFHTWRQRLPDGQPQQVTSGPTEEEGIAMSPDGRSFLTAVGVKQSSVWLHDGRGERQISLEGYAFFPKFTPDGKRLCYLVKTGASSELRVADVDTGRSDPLLPGFPAVGTPAYDISPDGLRVVVASPGQGGKPCLWLAPLDRRSAPRQIPGAVGEQPYFGPDGEVFFRKVEGTSGFVYRIREDGTGLRKAIEVPVAELRGMSPDHRWLTVYSTQLEGSGLWLAFPLAGGPPIRVPASRHEWPRDGKSWFWEQINAGVTRVIPLPPGQVWPRNPAGAVPLTSAEMEKLPGVRVIPSGDVAPGQTADVYAFSRPTVQRNLYRVPVP